MPVLNVAVLATESLLRSLGKISDSRDVESYVYKEGEGAERRILSMIRPLKHPESLRPLLSTLNVAESGIIEVKEINAALGEAMVAFSSSKVENGHIIINPKDGNWIDPEKLSLIRNQAGLESWKIHDSLPDPHDIRSDLLSRVRIDTTEEEVLVSIDQHFVVRGIGLVGIGYVRSGIIRKHESVEIHPGGHVGVVRSLQVMDDDVDFAVTGDRVGVALRGVQDNILDKGSQIVSVGSKLLTRMEKSEIKVDISVFQRNVLKAGDIVHMSCDLQFIVGRIESVSEENIVVVWDRPVDVRTASKKPPLLVQLDAGPMRIIGAITDIRPV
jgi:selenocysteine-specific translation elongation factor